MVSGIWGFFTCRGFQIILSCVFVDCAVDVYSFFSFYFSYAVLYLQIGVWYIMIPYTFIYVIYSPAQYFYSRCCPLLSILAKISLSLISFSKHYTLHFIIVNNHLPCINALLNIMLMIYSAFLLFKQ